MTSAPPKSGISPRQLESFADTKIICTAWDVNQVSPPKQCDQVYRDTWSISAI